MISFQEAREIVMASAEKMPVEQVALEQSLGRIIAGDVFSDMDMPVHDVSAMDGFACRNADVGSRLKVVETVPAGIMPKKVIGAGECARIMTGAVIPRGADRVVMFEHAREENGMVQVEKDAAKTHIRKQSEDLSRGDLVLKSGSLIGPVETAVLAGAGKDQVAVSVRPRVAIAATGNELVPPGKQPEGAQIRDSNSYQLCAQVLSSHCIPRRLEIVRDTPEAVETTMRQAYAESDVVVFCGGVSMGDFDYVPEVLKNMGADIRFSKIRVKPGKPTVFATMGKKYFFGLPGNPVSALILFQVLVRPFLYRLMGSEHAPLRLSVRLKKGLDRISGKRWEFRPVYLEMDASADPREYHGSAHIHAYTRANAIISIPPGKESLPEGTCLEAEIFS